MRSRLTPVGFVAPCLPSPVAAPPSGPGWLHEIKHDGFPVVVDAQGVASFKLLRSLSRAKQAFVWAFDLLELDGEDLRAQPLDQRRATLQALLKHAPFGLALNDADTGDGPALFAQACAMGLEGIVSKRVTSRYRSGRSSDWVKAKNPHSAAAQREAVEDWGRSR